MNHAPRKFTSLALACLVYLPALLAQPEGVRKQTEWRAVYGNQFFSITDDGEVTPWLAGRYRSNSIDYLLVRARYDYPSNAFSTFAVSGTNRVPILIYYSHEVSDGVVSARFGTNEILFLRQ